VNNVIIIKLLNHTTEAASKANARMIRIQGIRHRAATRIRTCM